MTDAYIVDGVRTPIGRLGGALSGVRADDLAAHALAALVRRSPSLDPARIADVVLGCGNQAGEDTRNVARMAVLLAGLPVTIPGETVNRLCGSGMSAAANAARAVVAGDGDIYIAGGVEQMTRAPYVLSKSPAPFARDAQLFDTTIGWRFTNPKIARNHGTDSMGETAENVAEQFGITRAEQDAYALRSHERAAAARSTGRFAREIAPVEIAARAGSPKYFERDECIRPDSSPELLARLKPVFRHDGGGSVTAGNSSGLNDGAAALLIASNAGVRELGAAPLARVVATTVVGVEPRVMGLGAVPASRLALARAGLSIDQMDVIELNEAFAATVLACLRELGVAADDERVNPHGGAIALGNPLAMSGARLLLTAAHQLQQTGGRYALCTMCVGLGQGLATILERT